MAYNRYEDALFAQAGASNPGAVLRAMVRHLDKDRSIDPRTDPAMRLMLHQLVHLMNIRELDRGIGQVHEDLMVACAMQSSEENIRICRAEHYLELGRLRQASQQQGAAVVAVADAP